MTKIITINGNRFVLPAGMSTKDIQALAGFLITLTPVDSEYVYETGASLYYATARSAEVRLESVELITQEEAVAKSKASREAYEARRAAEKAAAQ